MYFLQLDSRVPGGADKAGVCCTGEEGVAFKVWRGEGGVTAPPTLQPLALGLGHVGRALMGQIPNGGQ